jgi:parvulin-like peptidyl-prolyl isomerase
MTSPTVLLVNEQPISLDQTIAYLQTAGKLPEFLLDIMSQHVLAQEVQKTDLKLSSYEIEQLLIEFRADHELTNPHDFQAWLANRGLNYETFRRQFIWDLAVDDLKHQISQPRLPDYFQACKPFLDQVVLSWIGVDSEKQASRLHRKLNWNTKFAQLVKTQIKPNDEARAALEVPLSREEMPEEWLAAIDGAQVGAVVGPIATDNQWYFLCVEAVQPAELDADLEAELRDELFDQWLNAKVQDLTVQLQAH